MSIAVLVLGDSGVGKSTYTRHIDCGAAFNPNEVLATTIPYAFKTILYEVVGELVSLMFVDSGGTKQALLNMPSVTRLANIVFLVYDVTRYETFVSIREQWAPHVEKNCKLNPIKVLIGNQLDLVTADPSLRKVNEADALALKHRIGAAHCYEMSAIGTSDEAVKQQRLPLDIAIDEHLTRARKAAAAATDGKTKNPLLLGDDADAARKKGDTGCC